MREIKGLKLKIASSDDILSWSHGEVLKPETINYRSQRPEKDGLFSERIFGPIKDYECYCGKYKRIRYKGVVCDKCGVEVTRSSVRRERMGHITLAAPVSHIWFLRVAPSKISLFLDVPIQKLEKVIYYAAYIITGVNEDKRKAGLQTAEKHIKEGGEREADFLIFKEQLLALKVGKVLSEADFYALNKEFPGVISAGRGAEAVKEILEKIDLKKMAVKIEQELEKVRDSIKERQLLYRLKLTRSFIKNKQRPEWMIITVLPVLPPELRPMMALDGGRYATSDLNDLYRRVLNRNNRLKKLLDLKAPEVIVVNEKRMLQEAVDALIDNAARFGSQPQMSSQRRPLRSLADILKGKQGRFRQNLLGKRVDYSGRSVIVVGPELRLSQCGLPKKMALELFKPFVINKIIERGMAYNIRNANNLIAQASPEIWAILEEVIADKKVLLNRAPTLHRLGIQAFSPILIEDLAVKIPPMVCGAFNADFDGDQMAVHLPLTEEAQREADELMWSRRNLLKPGSGEPITTPTQDIILGCYHLTRTPAGEFPKKTKAFTDEKEAIIALEFDKTDINEWVKLKKNKNKPDKEEGAFLETTVGRIIFNSVLPEDFRFVNETMSKKPLQKLVAELIEEYDIDEVWNFLDAIKRLGFEYATVSGISWGMKDLVVPMEKKEIIAKGDEAVALIESQFDEGLLTDSERKARIVEVWEKTKAELATKVPKALDPQGPVYATIDSGARGSWSQPIQMVGMKGLVQNPKGETIELPIKSSYKEGLSVLEFFSNTHGARKGLTDTALKTASAGYLTRRLVDVVQDIIIREKDCRTTDSIEILREDGDAFGYKFHDRIFGRVAAEDIKVERKTIVKDNEIIGHKEAEMIGRSNIAMIKVRSPITCKSVYGVCSKCYGLDLGRNKPIKEGEAAGIVAAQSIGEPGTQLTLRTFHVGGVAGADITHGLPRIQELFEARVPKGKAPMAEFEAVVEDIEEKGGSKIIRLSEVKAGGKSKAKAKVKEYIIPRTVVAYVKTGDVIPKGTQLAEGSLDLKELFEYQGKNAVQRYVVNEVQKIYVSEGTFINDKHIEIIVRQMFSRVMIKDAGETDFVRGEVVEKSKFFQVNREAKKAGKLPAKAKQLLMGITKTALSTESFLSSASFQETARVLVKAAAEGKVDVLRGLKENVIIGRLIPAGTGLEEAKKRENQ